MTARPHRRCVSPILQFSRLGEPRSPPRPDRCHFVLFLRYNLTLPRARLALRGHHVFPRVSEESGRRAALLGVRAGGAWPARGSAVPTPSASKEASLSHCSAPGKPVSLPGVFLCQAAPPRWGPTLCPPWAWHVLWVDGEFLCVPTAGGQQSWSGPQGQHAPLCPSCQRHHREGPVLSGPLSYPVTGSHVLWELSRCETSRGHRSPAWAGRVRPSSSAGSLLCGPVRVPHCPGLLPGLPSPTASSPPPRNSVLFLVLILRLHLGH